MQKRKFNRSLANWTLILAACATPPLAHAQYSAPIDVGTFGGIRPDNRTTSAANAINNLGIVTGDSFVLTGGYHAFIYTNGVPPLFDIGTLGQKSCHSESINNSGTVCGIIGNSLLGDEGSILHAFVYTGGVMTDISPLIPNSGKSWARWVNNAGQVVGWYIDGVTGHQRPFLYSGGIVTDLGFDGVADGINDSGQIVGHEGGGPYQAVLITGGQKQVLTQLGNATANKINNQGQILGNRFVAANTVHAYLYSNGEVRDLGTLGGKQSGMAGLNDAGQVVGDADTASGTPSPYLYANGVMVDLNTLIPANTGWILTSAYGINNSGQIVGVGQFNGESRGFLLNPIPQNRVLSLDGQNGYISVPSAPDLQNPNEITVEAWVRPTLPPAGHLGNSSGFSFVAKSDGSAGDSSRTFEMVWQTNGTALFQVYFQLPLPDPVNQPHFAVIAAPVSQGVWTHVTGTYNTSSGLRIYTNGVLAAASTSYEGRSFIGLKLRQSALPVLLGGCCSLPTPSTFATADEDEIRIWKTARTEDQIFRNMTCRVPGDQTDLAAYWNFDDGSAKDQTTNHHDGTFSGSARTVASELPGIGDCPNLGSTNQVLSLDGQTGYISVPSASDLQSPLAFTIEAWINPQRGDQNNEFFINKSDNAVANSSRSYELAWVANADSEGPGNSVRFILFLSNGEWTFVDAPAAENTWVHIAASYSSSEGTLKLFTNGILADLTGEAHGKPLIGTSLRQTTLPIRFGRADSAPYFYARGHMDEVRIWSEARSVEEIASGVFCKRSGTEPALAGYWNFDDGTAKDQTINHHDGTFNGSAIVTPMEVPGLTDCLSGSVPIILTQPQSQTLNAGDEAILSVTAVGSPTLLFQWVKDGTEISRQTNSNLTLSNLSTNDAGNYKVIVSNSAGSTTSQAARLTVKTFAPSISVQPAPSQVVLEGATVTISVQASAAPPPSFQWQSNGTNLIGETRSSLVLNDVVLEDAGNYKVIVSNPFGSETSQAAAIQVTTVITLAQALGNTELYWQTGGDADWFAQTDVVHGGTASAQSGHIQNSQKSTLETTVNGPGLLHFWWKSSTELGFDKVVFAINGQDQATLSGEKDWEQASFNLPAGVQTLHWEYVKDGSGSGGQDKAWITDVAYAPNAGVSQPSYLFAKRRLGYRLFQMTFTGQKGHQFEIEKSKDLRNWSNLTTIQNTLGTMTIVDPGAQAEAREFYRAVQR